jgi:cytoplasmic iron level regulating protein YaaA (DUF328/UPF0246 family)
MKIILSPAKRLNEATKYSGQSLPSFLKDSEQLIKILKKLDRLEISSLMNLSPDLSNLNYNRFQNWTIDKLKTSGQSAVHLFEGDAYRGLDISSYNIKELENLNHKLFILSGLYGVLHPLDSILPYRLEMGTKLTNSNGSNLYKFWDNKLTKFLNKELDGGVLVNLASKEYSSVIDFKQLKSPVVQVDFLQENNGKHQNIAIFSKRARGLMTSFIVKNNIEVINDLQAFDTEGYYFNRAMSKQHHLVFSRLQS